MREKLKTLPLKELRAIAAQNGVARYYALKKAELIDCLMEIYEKDLKEKASPSGSSEKEMRENGENRVSEGAGPKDEPVKTAEPAKRKRGRPRKDENKTAEKAVSEERVQTGTDENAGKSPAAEAPVISKTDENTGKSPAEPPSEALPKNLSELDSGEKAEGILEVLADGYGFLRSGGYLPGEDDIYVAPSQIKRFGLKTGDHIVGTRRIKAQNERYSALLYIEKVNGLPAQAHARLKPFEQLTPVFPHERLHLVTPGGPLSLRVVDLLSPIGKGQRGLIVAAPKVGKTTLLKQIAGALAVNHPKLHILILLIDERPEEVTDMQESIRGSNIEVVFSTFDEQPEHHKRVAEMVIERARRLVENGEDVIILLDSITRLTRAYNLTCIPSGRTLSGGLDPAALYMPKRFFGAARAMREGGSLTILATALQDTGSRLDDVVYEEFKGTGNMELVLSRRLSERRIFPAVDILRSSTRRDDLLLTPQELEAASNIRRATTQGSRPEEAAEQILELFATTGSNAELIRKVRYLSF